MTTEDDFQNALDAKPDDWQTRLVFADWLDEQGDPRGPGYRTLALNRFVLCDHYHGNPMRYIPHKPSRIFRDHGKGFTARAYTLPADWYDRLPRKTRDEKVDSIKFGNRREAEDAAALAFAKLPAERRAGLLAPAQPNT